MIVDNLLENRIKEKFPEEKFWIPMKDSFKLILSQLSENLQEHYLEVLLDINSLIYFYHLKDAAESILSFPIQSQFKEDLLKKLLDMIQDNIIMGKLELIANFFTLLGECNFENGFSHCDHFFLALNENLWEGLYPIFNQLSHLNKHEKQSDYLQIILRNILPITPSLLKLKAVHINPNDLPIFALITCHNEPIKLLEILRCNPFSAEETPYWELTVLFENNKNTTLEEKPAALQMLIAYRQNNKKVKATFRNIFDQVIKDYKLLVRPTKRALFESQENFDNDEGQNRMPSPLQQHSLTAPRNRNVKTKKDGSDKGSSCSIC